MESTSMSITALGRIASLGDFYDVRKDDFVGISAFEDQIPESTVKLIDSNFSDIQFVHSDSFSEKFNKMHIKAELQVSILAGLVSLQGSGQYLVDQKTSSRILRSSLVYNIKTKEEHLNVYHKALKPVFSPQALKTDIGTHIVVGIVWGANSVVTCQYENRDNRDIKEIQGKLSAHVKALCVSISGKAEADIKEGDNSTDLSFNIRMYGDILPQNEELPTTFDGALKLMRKLPTLVSMSNQGKGKPISYTLLPISLIREYLGQTLALDTLLVRLELGIITKVVQLFDEMSTSSQLLHDFCEDIIEHAFCLSSTEVQEVKDFRNEMIILENSLKDHLSKTVIQVRCGKQPVSKLTELIEGFYTSPLSPSNLATKLDTWDSLNRKIDFTRMLTEAGVQIIARKAELRNKLISCADDDAFVIFHTDSEAEDENWHKNIFGFLKMAKEKKSNSRFFAVNKNIDFEAFGKDSSICVKLYRQGSVGDEDVFKNENLVHKSNGYPALSAMTKLQSIPFLTGIDIVYTDDLVSRPNDTITMVNGEDPDINKDFKGQYVWLVPKWTANQTSKAVTYIQVVIQGSSNSNFADMAKGTGGDYRYLLLSYDSYKSERITKLALYRTVQEDDDPLGKGWKHRSIDINRGRKGDYLYLVWN